MDSFPLDDVAHHVNILTQESPGVSTPDPKRTKAMRSSPTEELAKKPQPRDLASELAGSYGRGLGRRYLTTKHI